MLAAAERTDGFVPGVAPDWVNDWLSRRRSSNAAKPGEARQRGVVSLAAVEKPEEKDPQAEAKAAARRERLKQQREESILASVGQGAVSPREGRCSLTAEICAGAIHAARGLDEEAVAAMAAAMRGYDGAVALLEEPYFLEDWQATLLRIAVDNQAAPFLRGYATRRLHDRNAIAPLEAERQLSFALSPSVAPMEAGAWLEGFLSEAAQLLLHDETLFSLIDRWLLALDEDTLVNLLPGLRRSLTKLDRMERRRLLQQVDQGSAIIGVRREAAPDDARAEAAYAAALPLLRLILGMDGSGEH